jgi:hypothetical protein
LRVVRRAFSWMRRGRLSHPAASLHPQTRPYGSVVGKEAYKTLDRSHRSPEAAHECPDDLWRSLSAPGRSLVRTATGSFAILRTLYRLCVVSYDSGLVWLSRMAMSSGSTSDTHARRTVTGQGDVSGGDRCGAIGLRVQGLGKVRACLVGDVGLSGPG